MIFTSQQLAMVVTVMDALRVHSGHCSELLATLGDSLLELATIPCTIQCDVACLSPVLLWPEKVRGSCSVCVKAAVSVTFCSSVTPDH